LKTKTGNQRGENMRYKYKYIRPEFSWFRKEPKNYHGIIEEHGRQGWRLIQVLAPATNPGGLAAYFELIFEKEMD